MVFLLLILGAAVLLGVGFFLWRYYVNSSLKNDPEYLERVSPIINYLEKGRTPDARVIRSLADNPATRFVLFLALAEYGRESLFPEEYMNIESGAEASMAYWLCRPKQIGTSPDEMELMAIVPQYVDDTDETVDYYVFRYRMLPPHWAASDDWLMGIAGPYGEDSHPYGVAASTHSNYEPYDSHNSRLQVEKLHAEASKKNVYDPVARVFASF